MATITSPNSEKTTGEKARRDSRHNKGNNVSLKNENAPYTKQHCHASLPIDVRSARRSERILVVMRGAVAVMG